MRLFATFVLAIAPLPATAFGDLMCLATSVCTANGCAQLAAPLHVAFDAPVDATRADLAFAGRRESLPILGPPDAPSAGSDMAHFSNLNDGVGVEFLLDFRGDAVAGTLWLHDRADAAPVVVEAACLSPVET